MTPPQSKFQPFVPDDDQSPVPPGPREVVDAPDGSSIDAHLLDLRVRLRVAREERGACPSWDDLKADHAPGGARRPGHAERQTHVAVCHYCEENLKEWKQSKDYASDRLEAVERGVARGIAGGAMGLVRALGRALPKPAPPKPRAPKPKRAEKAPRPEKRAISAREERQQHERTDRAERAARPASTPPSVMPEIEAAAPEPYAPPATPRMAMSMEPRSYMMASSPAPDPVSAPAEAGNAPARLLVIEMADGRVPPESVFLCARVLGAEVVQVQSIEELPGDPDLPLVCGVILGGSRPPVTWPDAVRRARRIVPRRPVLLLAIYGAETTPGARRTLGDALISESDPPERMLVALDPHLR